MAVKELNREDSREMILAIENYQPWSELMKPWIEQYRADVLEKHRRLVMEDAAKSKFSVISGKIQFIEDLFEQIDAWKKP